MPKRRISYCLRETYRTSRPKKSAELSRLKAPDGIISVLGNHDYGKYIARDEKEKKTIERAIIKEEEGLGWTLLRSSHHAIRRGKDSIVIAGEEYDTSLDNPYKHPVSVSLDGIKPNSFAFKNIARHACQPATIGTYPWRTYRPFGSKVYQIDFLTRLWPARA